MESFENQVYGWVIRDADLDGYNWGLLSDTDATKYSYLGKRCIMSSSWITDKKDGDGAKSKRNLDESPQILDRKQSPPRAIGTISILPSKHRTSPATLNPDQAKGALTPDNWLISPRMQIGDDFWLTWRVAAQDPDWLAEKYSVLISTTTPDVAAFSAKYTETIADSLWLYRELDLSEYTGETIYIAFRHHDCTDQFFIKLDLIKIKQVNTDVVSNLVTEGDLVMNFDTIEDLTQGIDLDVTYTGSDLTNDDGDEIFGHLCYNHPGIGLPNGGLHLGLSGGNFANTEMTVVHNLGFVPLEAYWRIQPGGWNVINAASAEVSIWNDTTVTFTLTEAGKAAGDFDIVFPQTRDDTLPVELSYFGAIVSAQNYINITWVTQTETAVSGFQLYRAQSADLATAITIGPFIPATNTSQMQSYQYTDKELGGTGYYYYWLENIDLDGSTMANGPVRVYFDADGDNDPSVPVITGIAGTYPNPFNPDTTIKVGVSSAADAKLNIYNTRGQLVRVLLQRPLARGYYTVLWDGRDDSGKLCCSGVYFAVLKAGKDSFNRKLVLAK